MNVIDDARKRVRSNAFGIGAASRSAISKVVHSSTAAVLERLPRRASSWWRDERVRSNMRLEKCALGPFRPSSGTPSTGLQGQRKQTLSATAYNEKPTSGRDERLFCDRKQTIKP